MKIFFIHGFATGPAVWKFQIDEFSRYFSISTDLNEFPSSEETCLVGWSMGGWKAIELYQQYPKKVRAIVLVSAFAKYLRSEDYPWGTSPALLRKLEKRIKADFKMGLQYFYELVFPDKQWQVLIKNLPVPEEKDINRWFERLKFEDKRRDLSEIVIPTLIIHGDKDQIVPWEAGKFLNEKIKNSNFILLSGVGHAPMVEVPNEFNQHLKSFIEKYAKQRNYKRKFF